MEKQTGGISGAAIVTAMMEEQHKLIYDQFSKELKGLVSLKDFETLSKEFVAGESFQLVTSNFEVNGGHTYIWHNEKAERKGIIAVLDEQNVIVGIQVLELSSHPETDQLSSKTVHQLPFEDDWLVYWGGKDALLNYHYEYEHVRYAYDFIKVKNGYSFEGDPLKNESYYAFDQPVIAPAAGVVVQVIDGIYDNIPGEMNERQPEGNMVVIEHDNGERTMLAHFKQDSIVVKEGDAVVAGQLLGTCGNSGNSSEPHIHYQTSQIEEDGKELVIPITFEDGKEWVRGEIAVGK